MRRNAFTFPPSTALITSLRVLLGLQPLSATVQPLADNRFAYPCGTTTAHPLRVYPAAVVGQPGRTARGFIWAGALLLALFGTIQTAHAEIGLPALTSAPAPGGGQTYSLSLQTLLLLTSLSFLPAILLMMTGFTRIIIVLSLLRSAIGTPSSPPNQVLIGLALFLTFFIMSPVLDKIYTDAYLPFSENKLDFQHAAERGSVPLKAFMLRQTREADLALFVRISDNGPLQSADQVPLRILVPAYVTSELKTAFQIGFVVFIPFLIIDMVVASVLMSMGMMMVSPAIISLPFKIMLFVLADGWNLLIGSLAQSFYT